MHEAICVLYIVVSAIPLIVHCYEGLSKVTRRRDERSYVVVCINIDQVEDGANCAAVTLARHTASRIERAKSAA